MTSNAVAAPDKPNRWFSEALGPSFDGGFSRELLEFVCGDRLGAGMTREVFRFALDERYVIKFEPLEGHFQNVAEATIWNDIQFTELAKWFAPVKAISGCGRIMLQRYAEPLPAIALPAEVPRFFTDLKPGNWGRIGKQPVCIDYGKTLLVTHGLSKRMRRADWT